MPGSREDKKRESRSNVRRWEAVVEALDKIPGDWWWYLYRWVFADLWNRHHQKIQAPQVEASHRAKGLAGRAIALMGGDIAARTPSNMVDNASWRELLSAVSRLDMERRALVMNLVVDELVARDDPRRRELDRIHHMVKLHMVSMLRETRANESGWKYDGGKK